MKDTWKILLCMDSSDQAMNVVRYVSEAFSPEKTKVVLFHVNPEVPESFLDLRREPGFRSSVISTSAWVTQVKKNIEEFMENARSILLKADFPPDSIKVRVQAKKVGIARDIVKESQEGYDAAFVGRSGISRIKDVIMGSVANKLVGKISHIPLAVVGGNPGSSKILIGFDGSESAMKAVDCAGTLMSGSDREIMLCHVIRPMGLHLGIKMLFDSEQEENWINANIKEVEPAFAEAANRLINSGFAKKRVSSEILTRKASRAAAIIKKAEAEDFGTVFVGRRGLSIVEEFVIGRVSTKVLNMAHELAVWVV